MRKLKNVKVWGLLAAGVLAMSTASTFVRLAQAGGAPSLVVAGYRLGIATLVLTIPMAIGRGWRDYATLDARAIVILLLCGVLLALHFASWITSLEYTSVASSVTIVTTTPLWIGLASPLILKEKTPRQTWLGLGLAICGGIIVGFAGQTGSQGVTLRGDLLALSGAILMASYLIIGRSYRERLSLTAYLWIVNGTAAVVLLGWSAFQSLPLTGYSTGTIGWFIALGLIPQLIGHSAANYAVRHVSATLVAIAILGEPIGSIILAAIVLKELPGELQLVGGLLILAGIGLASLADTGSKEPAAANPIT
ncbi:MAG: DMT family transporter [Anaerolineae bacterium]|nr:DMT family transporter [Anaerolineae bacterium]